MKKLIDDRSKGDDLQIVKIIFENSTHMLVKVKSEDKKIKEPLLICKKTRNVLNSDYYSYFIE